MQNSGQTPGPGQYSLDKGKHVNGGIIGHRYQSARDGANKLGPGQYEQKSSFGYSGHNKTQDKGFSTVGHNFGGKGNSNPGPGNYCVSEAEYGYNRVGFGTSKREQAQSSTLGPGQY